MNCKSNNLLVRKIGDIDYTYVKTGLPRGAKPGDIRHSKITRKDAEKIRVLLKSKLYKQKDLAKKYKISASQISFIHCRKSWK